MNFVIYIIILSIVIILGAFVLIIKNRETSATRKLIQSLTEYNKKLKNLDKEKTDFVSTASHQLRSPNSVVSGYSSMLLEGDFGDIEEKQKEIIQHIFDASTDLNNVINELLDATRIEAKKMKYSIVEFDIVLTIRNALGYYKGIAKKKNIKLIKEYNKEDQIFIKGDREKIRQAMLNMFDNAIKYTENGKVIIGIKKENKHVYITIEDTGIGIKKEELEGLFNKFVRASNAESFSVMGSGLGLFIAKEIIVSNKGKITAHSEGEGKGSKFIIEFPVTS